ncbi:hypothetical protein CC80DRAFT_507350 [Byssothecium circinans]|uniref:F-box domain-containing protein n=1 Tax=Byssothecium circinans TaxID=147558 RepID=A0A6A5TLT3_9PLEO|nr:hypothetical protein CC80DRAFT_507350 [Byssothecium circinans]
MLADLPTELVSKICGAFERVDLHNVRLVCKALSQKTLDNLYALHFKTSPFMLTRASLEKLIEFSKMPRISGKIRKLELVLVTFPIVERKKINGEPFTTKEQQEVSFAKTAFGSTQDSTTEKYTTARLKYLRAKFRRARRKKYAWYHHDQHLLRTKSIDVSLLVEALRNLTALESIATTHHYDKDSPPWGLRQVVDELGIWPVTTVPSSSGINNERAVFAKHSVGVVLGALCKSGIKRKTTSPPPLNELGAGKGLGQFLLRLSISLE